ncbi:MAG TPA: hypothetical protein VK483_11435 [Chitinophagaceae bacterium]|nr:hypothetical protein [Chitinophagaceae bacterium]
MKKIIFSLLLALGTSGVMAQKDLANISAMNQLNSASYTASKQETSDQLTIIDALTIKLEADLKKINTELDKLKDQRDSLSKQGEEQQLKMKMIMERMIRADQAASNAMKKFSEITGQIIGNMK